MKRLRHGHGAAFAIQLQHAVHSQALPFSLVFTLSLINSAKISPVFLDFLGIPQAGKTDGAGLQGIAITAAPKAVP